MGRVWMILRDDIHEELIERCFNVNKLANKLFTDYLNKLKLQEKVIKK